MGCALKSTQTGAERAWEAGPTEQRETPGSGAVSEVAQLILEGALELGWPVEARGLRFYILALVSHWIYAILGVL